MIRKIPVILDGALVFFAGGLAAFSVLRFYSTLAVSAVFALLVAALVLSLYILVSKRRSTKFALKARDMDEYERVMTSLCLMTEKELADYFCDLLSKMRLPFTREGDLIALTEKKAEIRFLFTFGEAYEGKIIDMYKETGKGLGLIVAGREFGEGQRKLTDRFAGRITLVGGEELFLLMKRFELMPPVKEELKSERTHFSLPRALFSRRRAAQYFLYGLTLEFFGLFVFYPIYYVCFGAALMTFSLVCLFFGIRDNPARDNPFR